MNTPFGDYCVYRDPDRWWLWRWACYLPDSQGQVCAAGHCWLASVAQHRAVSALQRAALRREAGEFERILDPEENAHDGLALKCPECGWPMTHTFAVHRIMADDYSAWTGRGDACLISMYCEEDHSFGLVIGEHKGTSYMQVITLSPLTRAQFRGRIYDLLWADAALHHEARSRA